MDLNGLYYPFSRCINLSSLKQMLLVFDSITFLEPVLDDEWRAELYKNLETKEDKRYRKYRDLYHPLQELKAEGAVKFISPYELENLPSSQISASSLSDLMDEHWISIASNPSAFNMPHRLLGKNGSPSWDIFKAKLPESFINVMRSNENFSHHLIKEGGERYNWTFSYEAGSSIATNYHLAAADFLGLSPTTDSSLHHTLLITKYLRAESRFNELDENKELLEVAGQKLAITMIDKLLDEEELCRVSFDEILDFRSQTRKLRKDFVKEINQNLSVDLMGATGESLVHVNQEIIKSVQKEIRDYGKEVISTKKKLWPALVGSLNKGLATGGLGAVAFNYLGGAEYLLLGSILAGSMTFLTDALKVKNEMSKNKIMKSASASYISSVQRSFDN